MLPLLAVLSLLIAALWLAADAESAQSQLGRAYVWLLFLAAGGVLALVAVVASEAWRLTNQWRMGEPGSRLKARFALLIAAIAVPPIILVSGFAMRFVDAGIDSWFRADVASSQLNAEAIGREVLASFERRSRDLSKRFANDDDLVEGNDLQAVLDALVEGTGDPLHLSLYDDSGNVLAISFNTSAVVFPSPPNDDERLQVRSAGELAINERLSSTLVWRVLDPVPGVGILQAVFPIPVDLAPRLDELERTAVDYAQLKYQRRAMKSTFLMILGLVGLLALLGALYAAFATTRRLIQPITDLALATRDITAGRYGQSLSVPSNDELGFLTQSFNRMSQELLAANARERLSRDEIERNRTRLEAILERLSAGVISFSESRVLTANQAAGALLEIDSATLIGTSIDDACQMSHRAAPLFSFLRTCAAERRSHWRDEIRLRGDPARALLVRGTLLPGDGEMNFVAVFDDAAVIALSQREAAWAEVAKRLAHEIKNPLTPIQLAAERLRQKYLGKMTAEDSEVLDRATQTIVSQVDALKRIVNAFGDYTRPVTEDRQSFDLRSLVDDVGSLYEHSGQCQVRREFLATSFLIRANKERLRQAIINLFTNAIEASEAQSEVGVDVQILDSLPGYLSLVVRDHGQGLPQAFDERWFEPYNTTKPKGTGLGLAWVKKIAEEHGGTVTAKNAEGGGAQFTVTLPMYPSATPHLLQKFPMR